MKDWQEFIKEYAIFNERETDLNWIIEILPNLKEDQIYKIREYMMNELNLKDEE